MKAVIIIFLLLCASLSIEAQQFTPSATPNLAKLVSAEYIWPDSLFGKHVNIKGISIDSKGWIYVATVGDGFNDGLVWRSKNKGKSWEHLTKGLEDVFFYGATSIYMLKDETLLISGINGIWRSLDHGDTWKRVLYDGLGTGVWSFIQVSPDTVFAGGRVIWESTNRGETWSIIDESRLPPAIQMAPIDNFTISKNGTLFAGLNGVLRSTDKGRTWVWSNQGAPWSDDCSRTEGITADVYRGSIFVGSFDIYGNEKIFRSVNDGLSWEEIENPGGEEASCFTVSEKYGVFLGKEYVNRGIFNSVDNGNTWRCIGLEEARIIMSFAWISEDSLLVGTSDGMYLVVLGVLTSAGEDKIPQIVDFSLSQNYPNPFNPSTKINFSVPKLSFVTLKVYNVLGKEVTTLVQEEKSPGSYSVEFNASNLPSGTYFYRLQIGDVAETKKMMFLK